MAPVIFKLRRGDSTEWIEDNPTLAEGEPGVEQDTNRLKIGDGVTPWIELPYSSGGNGSGEPGPEGPQGVQGIQGPIGPQGVPGPEGPIGPEGPQGIEGPQGTQGPKGDQGDPGSGEGTEGPEGPMGPEGPQGIQGPVGPAGADGAEGPQGIQGPVGPMGPEGPAGTGDGGEGTVGPAGPEGPQGPQGIQGPIGPEGPEGPIGPEGPQGIQGVPGVDGTAEGIPGPEGPQGIQGIQGPIGPAGTDGTDGAMGPEGPQGPQGIQGPQGLQGPSGQAAGKILYPAPSMASDISGYKKLLTSPSPTAEQVINTPTPSMGTDVLIATFATEPGEIGAVDYPAGTAMRRIYASINVGTARIRVQVYKRNAAGVETLVRDEYSDPFSNSVVDVEEWQATASAVGALLATDRIVAKVYVQRYSGGGSGSVVSTYWEGTTHTSLVQTTISAGAQGPEGPQGIQGPAGATGPGVASGGSTGQVLAKKTATNYDTEWIAAPSGGAGGHVIRDEATDLTARSKLAFIGDGVTASDDLANNATVVSIPGVRGGVPQPPVTLTRVSDGDTNGLVYWLGTRAGSYALPIPDTIGAVDVSGSELRVFSSSTYSDANYTMAKAFDRANVACFSAVGGANQFLALDLKTRLLKPNYLTLKSRADGNTNHLKSFALDVSNDALGWTPILTVADAGYTAANQWKSWPVTPPSLGYRYLRIRSTGPDSSGAQGLLLGEIELYGTLELPPISGATPTLQDEGVALPVRPAVNFAGMGITAVDDPATDRTIITVSGGSGGLQESPTAAVRAAWSGAVSATSGAWTSSSGAWTEALDTPAGQFDPSNGRFTPSKAGLWMFIIQSTFAPNATGGRGVGLRLNGGASAGAGGLTGPNASGTSSATTLWASLIEVATLGDYYDIQGIQVSGTPLNMTGLSFQAVYLGGGFFDASWIVPTLSGTYGRSASAVSAGEKPMSYRRNGGQITVRGYVDQGFNAGVPIFTLPSGYRPEAVTPLTVESGIGGANIEVRPNGDVVWTGGGQTFLRVRDQSFWSA